MHTGMSLRVFADTYDRSDVVGVHEVHSVENMGIYEAVTQEDIPTEDLNYDVGA